MANYVNPNKIKHKLKKNDFLDSIFYDNFVYKIFT